jgi:hypothetical protein
MDFTEIHLNTAYPIQLHVSNRDGNKGRYFCRYIGCVKNKTILVSPLVTGGQDVDLGSGGTVTARLMTGRGICVFPTRVLQVQQKPVPVMYLEYPELVDFKPIRNAERVETNLNIIVNNALRRDQVSEGKLCDVSITGARIELYKAVADLEDEVIVSGDYPIESISQTMRINAVIRSRIKAPQQNSAIHQPITYGLEFIRMPDDKRLILYGYVNYLLAQTYLPHV